MLLRLHIFWRRIHRARRLTCYRLIVADGLQYEYPDVSVRMRFPCEGAAEVGGVVFGVEGCHAFLCGDRRSCEEDTGSHSGGGWKGDVLGDAVITPKPVAWHTLRIQRNTIISKDFIEIFFDGQLLSSVEDQSLAIGQVGLLVRGKTALHFDSLHAVPLFSQRPVSAPAAY